MNCAYNTIGDMDNRYFINIKIEYCEEFHWRATRNPRENVIGHDYWWFPVKCNTLHEVLLPATHAIFFAIKRSFTISCCFDVLQKTQKPRARFKGTIGRVRWPARNRRRIVKSWTAWNWPIFSRRRFLCNPRSSESYILLLRWKFFFFSTTFFIRYFLYF